MTGENTRRLRTMQDTDTEKKVTQLPLAHDKGNFKKSYCQIPKTAIPFFIINCILLFLYIGPPLFSQDTGFNQAEDKLNQWYHVHKNANNYKGLYNEFLAQIKVLIEENITTDYFYEKLNQGLSKSVTPERLIIALKEDVYRLVQAKMIIQKLGVPEDGKINQANIKSLSIYLKAGLPIEFFDSLLKDYPLFKNPPQGKAEEFTPIINQFLLLCEAMVKINQASQIENEQLVKLALALIKSPMEPRVYETLASMYTRAKLNHLSDTVIISTMIEILQNNGGIIEITDQLNRRMKYR